ncbi:hypothetical protein ACFOX0_30175 [Micromonospora zhanjiangensis]|uniref:Uncharacterized protein n=1 Tax=Micromonospora zhanjiangensis TaxID=1522057 RepID=A0ABV8KWC7_9ACTN
MSKLSRRRLGALAAGAIVTALTVAPPAAAAGLPAARTAASTIPSYPASRVLSVVARDDALRLGRSTVSSGLVALDLRNAGTVDHEALLMKLKPGVTVQQYVDTLTNSGLGAANALLVYSGGANVVRPGKSQVTVQSLTAGQYLVLSYAQDENAVPEVVKGMYTPLTVVDDGAPSVTLPAGLVKGMITAHDMTYTLPSTLDGHGVYQFTVTDPKVPHEVGFIRLAPGVTRDDVLDWAMTETGPKPFTAAGGFGALPTGGTGWFYLDLPPGQYAAICFVHSPYPPYESHAAMGQIVLFTVN